MPNLPASQRPRTRREGRLRALRHGLADSHVEGYPWTRRRQPRAMAPTPRRRVQSRNEAHPPPRHRGLLRPHRARSVRCDRLPARLARPARREMDGGRRAGRCTERHARARLVAPDAHRLDGRRARDRPDSRIRRAASRGDPPGPRDLPRRSIVRGACASRVAARTVGHGQRGPRGRGVAMSAVSIVRPLPHDHPAAGDLRFLMKQRDREIPLRDVAIGDDESALAQLGQRRDWLVGRDRPPRPNQPDPDLLTRETGLRPEKVEDPLVSGHVNRRPGGSRRGARAIASRPCATSRPADPNGTRPSRAPSRLPRGPSREEPRAG